MNDAAHKPETDWAKALVKTASAVVAAPKKGKVDWAAVWSTLTGESSLPDLRPDRTPAKVKPLTDEEELALNRLPEIYGKVHPTTVRILNSSEQKTLVEERGVIDVLLGLLKRRKDEEIREVIANHLDCVLEASTEDEDDLKQIPLDAKGHYQTKQEFSVEGSGKKFQKTVSDPKPVLTAAGVHEAFKDGVIDRKTYLAITVQPEVERDLSEEKLTKAVKANPDLLWVLRGYTKTPSKITTIKVEKDT